MKKKFLITGSEGFIGYYLTQFLSKKNYLVYGTYKNKKNFCRKKNVSYIKCDIRNFISFKKIILKIKPDVIFHLAAKSHPNFSFNNPIETINTNVKGTINLLEICRKFFKTPKIILACSSAQYGSRKFKDLPMSEKDTNMPEHIYGLSKVFQDKLGFQYHKMYALKVVRAILFNTSGPGKSNDVFNDICKQFARKSKLKNEITISCGSLKNQRDFMHVDDVVEGLYTLANKGKSGHAYNIGSGKLTKIKEIISFLKKFYKKKIIIKRNKNLIRKFDEKFICSDNNKVKSLNWKPKKNVEDIIKDMVSHYS